MGKTFNNFRVGTKILIGYVIALFLMAIVIFVAVARLQKINDTVTELAENLATEQHLADQVVANVWATHFYALQYMDQQNPADLERYLAEFENFNTLLDEADYKALDENRLAYLDDINSGIETFGSDFNDIIELLDQRNHQLLVNLDQQGRLAEIKLEQIRANSFFADDTDTSYQAGNAQRALLLMRVAAFQYLESGDSYWADEFDRSHKNAQSSFQKLDETIQSNIYKTVAKDAESAVETYAQTFVEIQKNFLQQQQIVAEQLNISGPEIREAGSAMSADVSADFQDAAAITQSQATQTRTLLLSTMGLAIVAALGSGLLISHTITSPLAAVTEVAHQIAHHDLKELTSEMDAMAEGDLTRHLTISTRGLAITSKDEIGQMAGAFNAIIQQVRGAGAAFSDMATNLRVLTERNAHLFQEAQVARNNAEAASQAKSNFLANMSHELRTPLNAILGYTQILKRDQGLPVNYKDGLAVIQESGQHLLTLINDILDLAKIESGKLWLQPSVIHLPTFLDNVVSMMSQRADEKGLAFQDLRDQKLPAAVEVDEKRLRQVLINLLGNAIKFTEVGSVSLQIDVINKANHRPGEDKPTSSKCIRFLITDTGIGIDPQYFKQIFQPFEQINADVSHGEGTGLGLSISQQIVQGMNSEIRIESDRGVGSKLWFELMLPVIEMVSHDEKKSPAITAYTGSRKKILVVDDKKHNLTLLQSLLTPLGFEITTADNGERAIELAVQYQPDLIILDLLMPGKSGIETLQEIRRRTQIEDTIVIGTSAAAVYLLDEAVGFDDFLMKPIDYDRLLEMLETHLAIEWNYESSHMLVEGAKSNRQHHETGDLTPPAAHILSELHDLAMKGNMPGISRRSAELESSDALFKPFFQELMLLSKAYDEDKVLTFLESFMVRVGTGHQ